MARIGLNAAWYGSARPLTIDLENPVAAPFEILGQEIGRMAAQRGHIITWGGSTGGAMGTAPKAAIEAGGLAVAGSLQSLGRFEPPVKLGASLRLMALSWGMRKHTLYDFTDGAFTTIGGAGSVDEWMSGISLGLDGVLQKPYLALFPAPNNDNPFAHFLIDIDLRIVEGYVPKRVRNWIDTVSSAEEAWDKFEGGVHHLEAEFGARHPQASLSRSNHRNGSKFLAFSGGLDRENRQAESVGRLVGPSRPSILLVGGRKNLVNRRALQPEMGHLRGINESIQRIVNDLYGSARLIYRGIDTGRERAITEAVLNAVANDPEHRGDPAKIAQRALGLTPRSIVENRTGDRNIVNRGLPVHVLAPTHYHAADFYTVHANVAVIFPGGIDSRETLFHFLNMSTVSMSLNRVAAEEGRAGIAEVPKRVVLYNPGGLSQADFADMISGRKSVEEFEKKSLKGNYDYIILGMAKMITHYKTMSDISALLHIATTEREVVEKAQQFLAITEQEKSRLQRFPQRHTPTSDFRWMNRESLIELENLVLNNRGSSSSLPTVQVPDGAYDVEPKKPGVTDESVKQAASLRKMRHKV